MAAPHPSLFLLIYYHFWVKDPQIQVKDHQIQVKDRQTRVKDHQTRVKDRQIHYFINFIVKVNLI